MMSPRKRLIYQWFWILVILLLDIWVDRLAIPGIDYLFDFALFGIAFTLFATAGVVNAFNLIDGLNGFSSFVTVSTMAISSIAFMIGEYDISIAILFVASITLGFMALNFPFGKIFLGDAGAYTLGHVLVWSAILIFNADVFLSPFAILLLFFWPVADTGLAIWRRLILGKPTDSPDSFSSAHNAVLEIRF